MTSFFTADWHRGSKNIIQYCNRPFESVAKMDEALINNYNSRVTKYDRCYFLGDSVWGHQHYREVFEQLNGEKFIVLGNHDNEQAYKKLLIDHVISGVYKVKGITIDNQYIWLSHYPHRSWNKSFHGAWHLYGHVHNTIPDYGLSCDVGADKWRFFPVSFEELKEYFKDKNYMYNLAYKDNHELYRENFEKHFTEKYKERTEKEASLLENLI